jgi:hypothetical protein
MGMRRALKAKPNALISLLKEIDLTTLKVID